MIIFRQKDFSSTSYIPNKKEIQYIKDANFPRFYIYYLEKINPLIQRALNVGDEELPIASRVNNDFWDSMLANETNWDDYFVEFNEKYAPMWYKVTGDDLIDELSNGIVFVDKDKNYYEKKGIFFSKFIEIDPKKYFLNFFEDYKNKASIVEIKKICDDIINLIKSFV